jgi:RNA polymerase sigma-70 factor (ECF subfamily)
LKRTENNLLPGPEPLETLEVAGSDVPAALPPMNRRDREARLRGLIDQYLDFVARVLRNAGVPEAQIDDDVQRIAAHARRTVARRREVHSDEIPEIVNSLATPEQLTDQKRARQLLDHVLSQMDSDLRTVFLLYEFEEMSMAEIAGVLRIPQGTVASRLRRARAEFRDRVRALEGSFKAEVGS